MDTQQLIQTRIDLETMRPYLIAAILNSRGLDLHYGSLPVQKKLIALRNDLDGIIDDLLAAQRRQGKKVAA